MCIQIIQFVYESHLVKAKPPRSQQQKAQNVIHPPTGLTDSMTATAATASPISVILGRRSQGGAG